jgi:hypothetical protein
MSAAKKKLKKLIDSEKLRNHVAEAMRKRYKNSKMRDRRMRRAKDYKKSWRRDWE